MSRGQISDAYIFRPLSFSQPITKKLKMLKFSRGKLLDQVLQVYNEEISQIIRVYKNKNEAYIEFDWLVGVQQSNCTGKSVITKFIVDDFINNGIFYTDSNCRQIIKRIRNGRSDYYYNFTEEPVASNYYPVTSRITLRDTERNLEVVVLNDRSQGGSSLEDGEIELMVHRTEAGEDGRGLGEALIEKDYDRKIYARGNHYLNFEQIKGGTFQRHWTQKALLSPVILIADATSENLSLKKVQKLVNFEFKGLKNNLPENVQILTLEPWKGSYILRLEHIFKENEDEVLSSEVVVDLQGLFTMFDITELIPVTLGVNQKYKKSYTDIDSSLVFSKSEKLFKTANRINLNVTLKPMEIKTFILKTNRINSGGYNVGFIEYRSESGSESETSGTQLNQPVIWLIIVIISTSLYLLV